MPRQIGGRQDRVALPQSEQSFDGADTNQRDRIARRLPQRWAGVCHAEPPEAGGGGPADARVLVFQRAHQGRGSSGLAELPECAGRERTDVGVRIVERLSEHRQAGWMFEAPQHPQGRHAGVRLRQGGGAHDFGQRVGLPQFHQRGQHKHMNRPFFGPCHAGEQFLQCGVPSVAQGVQRRDPDGRKGVLQCPLESCPIGLRCGPAKALRCLGTNQHGRIQEPVFKQWDDVATAYFGQGRVGRDAQMLLRIAHPAGDENQGQFAEQREIVRASRGDETGVDRERRLGLAETHITEDPDLQQLAGLF